LLPKIFFDHSPVGVKKFSEQLFLVTHLMRCCPMHIHLALRTHTFYST